ncbi:MAG: glycosyl hydrolase family protein [Chitinophagaceae bacterium]|nr:glycosyl hydrolase family protein [Chitinophagaceae bacterium]
MKKITVILFKLSSIISILFLSELNTAYTQNIDSAVKTKIVAKNNGFILLRDGKPYFIKGAGGTSYSDRLAKYGGNSIRTWNTRDGEEVLNKANQLGLTVTMGLNVARERHGFNYNDTVAVKQQLEKLRLEVRKYKNYPALLIWGIGNELNLEYKNPKVWDAVNDITKMIHEEDPNHLVTTMLAGINKREIDYIKSRCPQLDLLSIQEYGGLAGVPQKLRSAGWEGPYMVTEWGPTGHWESMQTPWKASIEETSSQKAAVYKSRYEVSIKQDNHCIGSYVFLWGQKQERTPTWYGLFTEKGEESEVVDVMQYLWTGKWPKDRAPHVDSVLLNNKKATDIIYLEENKNYPVAIFANDPDKDKLAIRWELLPESTDLKNGGDRESRPVEIPGSVTVESLNNSILKTPAKEGAYRLFLYISDGYNKVATANIPFYVK